MAKTSRDVWAKRVERWQDSKLTAKEFAEEIGVNPRTLSHWKWMLGRQSQSAAKRTKKKSKRRKQVPTTTFREINVTPLVATAAIEVVLDERKVVRVAGAFDEEVLRRVLDVVEERG